MISIPLTDTGGDCVQPLRCAGGELKSGELGRLTLCFLNEVALRASRSRCVFFFFLNKYKILDRMTAEHCFISIFPR